MSERMPEEEQFVYLAKGTVVAPACWRKDSIGRDWTHWMQRFVPESPKEEEKGFVEMMTKFMNESETPYSKVAYKKAILVYERIHKEAKK